MSPSRPPSQTSSNFIAVPCTYAQRHARLPQSINDCVNSQRRAGRHPIEDAARHRDESSSSTSRSSSVDGGVGAETGLIRPRSPNKHLASFSENKTPEILLSPTRKIQPRTSKVLSTTSKCHVLADANNNALPSSSLGSEAAAGQNPSSPSFNHLGGITTMPKAVKGALLQCDPPQMAMVKKIDRESNNAYIIEEIDEKTCLVKENKVEEIKKRVKELMDAAMGMDEDDVVDDKDSDLD